MERFGQYFAARQVSMTPDCVSTFTLDPRTPEDSPNLLLGWEAACQRGVDARRRLGSLADCIEWLEDQQKVWDRQQKSMESFIGEIESRPKWKLHVAATRISAVRVWHYPGAGAREMAMHIVQEYGRYPWRNVEASVSLPFSAGPEVSAMGRTFSELKGWIQRIETGLSAPLKIGDAPSYVDADLMLRKAADTSLYLLACLYDIDPYEPDREVRRQLVMKIAQNPVVVAQARKASMAVTH